jgi:hypothetical protein
MTFASLALVRARSPPPKSGTLPDVAHEPLPALLRPRPARPGFALGVTLLALSAPAASCHGYFESARGSAAGLVAFTLLALGFGQVVARVRRGWWMLVACIAYVAIGSLAWAGIDELEFETMLRHGLHVLGGAGEGMDVGHTLGLWWVPIVLTIAVAAAFGAYEADSRATRPDPWGAEARVRSLAAVKGRLTVVAFLGWLAVAGLSAPMFSTFVRHRVQVFAYGSWLVVILAMPAVLTWLARLVERDRGARSEWLARAVAGELDRVRVEREAGGRYALRVRVDPEATAEAARRVSYRVAPAEDVAVELDAAIVDEEIAAARRS